MVAIFLLFILVQWANGSPECDKMRPGQLHSIGSLNSCLDSIPFLVEPAAATVIACQKIFEAYPFLDIARAAPPPFTDEVHIDASKELEIIANGRYARDFDFHERLTVLFNAFCDGHTRYVMPADYRGLGVVLPFPLTSRLSPDGSKQQFFIGLWSYQVLT